MGQQIKRAEVVPMGVLVVFSDDREALIANDELLAVAEQYRAFERARLFRTEDETQH